MALARLEHVLVLTDDLEATRRFYCDVLGFAEGARPAFPFRGHWLYLGGTPCVHVADRAEYEVTAARTGLDVDAGPVDHVAFAADGYDELEARLAEAGVEVTANTVPGTGLRQLFFDDPNGLRVELNMPG